MRFFKVATLCLDGSFAHKAFPISSWNIQVLRSSAFGLKSRNRDFTKEIRNTDIVILQETWFRRGDGPTGYSLGYRELVVPSTKLPGVKQGRDSGRIGIE